MSTSLYAEVPQRNRRRLARRAKVLQSPARGVIEQLESRVLLTSILSPLADSFIRNNAYAATNYGASPLLYVENGSAGADSRTALLTFDLTGISAITSATLRVDASLEYPDSPAVNLGVYPVASSSWTEGSGTINSRNGNGTTTNAGTTGPITWNNAPTIATSPLTTNPTAVTRFGMETYSFDLTSYVNSLPAGTTTVSFALNEPTQGAQWVQVLSKESGQFGPQLVINGTGATSVPVATVTAPDVTDASSATMPVSVLYSGDLPIDQSTLNLNNTTISGPAGTLQVLDVSVAQSSAPNAVTAVYDVAAPAGGWNALDNGLYTVTVQPNQVAESGGGTAPVSQGQFRVAVNDTTAPTATINAANITSGGGSTYQFSIGLTDDIAVDTSWADVDNVQVLGPKNQSLTVTSAAVDIAANGTPRTITTYTVAAPSGTWGAGDDGTYTINLLSGQLRDTAGNAAAAQQKQFSVNIVAPDTTPPTATVSAPSVTAPGGTSETVTVTYSDNIAVDVSTINIGNITVTGPLGPLTVSAAQVIGGNGSPVTATYTVAAPGGTWNSNNNGVYNITVVAGGVKDTSGNGVVTATGSFAVTATLPDTTPPTASVSAPPITSPGGTSEAVTVTYSDNVAVDSASINVGNITVIGPNGPLTVSAVQLSGGNGASVTATYTVNAPGGSWDATDNGAYQINVVAGSVKDTSGNGVTAASGSFDVNATLPDTIPPSAQINAPNITSGGASSATIIVLFTDNVAVNSASIGIANISVTGPSGALTVTSATPSGGTGSQLTVTYTVAARHGTWESADDGSYTIALNPNQVSDTSGNFAGGASGSFSVNILAANPGPMDNTFNGGQAVDARFVTEAILSQPDGKVLAAGREGDLSTASSRAVIERFNADGSIDATFGDHGMIVGPTGANEAYFAVMMQDAGHFLVAGASGGDFVLARYDLSGNLDSSFATGGRAMVDFGTTTDAARSIALAPGGMIVVGGDSGGNFAFARFDGSGHLDPNFAQNGRQLFGLGDGSDNGLSAIVVQPSGAIVAAGSEASNVVVVHLTAAGEADGSFGNGGLVVIGQLAARTDLGGPDRSEGLALQSNGDILVANRTVSGHFGLVRLNPSGTVDTTFGTNGLVTANFGGDDDADAVIAQSAGPIILVGTSLQSVTAYTAVAAFDPSGNPLTAFGNQGLLTLPSGVQVVVPSTKHSGKALHIGDIVLRAFGTVTSDGRVVIGTSNEAVSATTSSTLRRLIVPGAIAIAGKDAGVVVGTFTAKTRRIVSHGVTFTLSGGTGNLLFDSTTGRFSLDIDDTGKGVTLTITGKKPIELADVTISGTLKALNARNANLRGTLHVTGAIGKLTVGNISGNVWSGSNIGSVHAGDMSGNFYATGALGNLKFGAVSGTVASAGVVGRVQAASLDSARILSGADLGADGQIGGSGANQDAFGAGAIGAVKVKGGITTSFIGAGVNPVDSTFGNNDDKLAGGGTSSSIHLISAKSADTASRFEAGAFGKATLPKLIDIPHDARFKVLT